MSDSCWPSTRARRRAGPSCSTGTCSIAGIGAGGVHPALPRSGWVEHDAGGNLGDDGLDLPRRPCAKAGITAEDIAAIGITNQRETTIVWDRATGKADPQRHRLAGPAHRRFCEQLQHGGPRAAWSPRKTGLLLDPYFSGTKIAWILDNVAGARARAETRRARFRHRRQLPDLAADRRPGARDRRHQCLPHAALQHRRRTTGTTSCLRSARRAARRCCPR